MSGLLGKIPKFTLKLPASLGKAGRTMSECPLELSFSLCDENSCGKQKPGEPSQVHFTTKQSGKQEFEMQNKETPEKAEEEKSEKEENMEVTCSVSVDGQERQEFSFTLYDFDTRDKVNKQDVEKVVVRSICEALGKTLKLPPSGSRTIKVKLAISPDSSKDIDTKEQAEDVKWPTEILETASPPKVLDCNSAKSANTSSTYLLSSVTDKPPLAYSRNNSTIPQNLSSSVSKPVSSPKLRSVRNGRVAPSKQEAKMCVSDHERKLVNESLMDNRHLQNEAQTSTEEQCNHPNSLPTTNRDHVPECRDRRNHYLDLAGIEHEAKFASNSSCNPFISSYGEPSYICPYQILDRTHVCSKSHRTKESSESPAKKSVLCHPKINTGNTDSARTSRTKVNIDTQDDLLNLNFDLCDLVPEAKFDWEKIHHRRSKSYDMYDSEFHNATNFCSPKLKQRPSQNISVTENIKNPGHTSSPVHHYRHRHRERERQRAMQQVANWIAREHSSSKDDNGTHFLCGGFSKPPATTIVDKHERHHLHEHIHHHYHHFVEF